MNTVQELENEKKIKLQQYFASMFLCGALVGASLMYGYFKFKEVSVPAKYLVTMTAQRSTPGVGPVTEFAVNAYVSNNPKEADAYLECVKNVPQIFPANNGWSKFRCDLAPVSKR
jgi:hypothetical protein